MRYTLSVFALSDEATALLQRHHGYGRELGETLTFWIDLGDKIIIIVFFFFIKCASGSLSEIE